MNRLLDRYRLRVPEIGFVVDDCWCKVFQNVYLGDDEVKANCSMGLMNSFHTIDSGFTSQKTFQWRALDWTMVVQC